MAKTKVIRTEFTLREARHHAARGVQSVLTAIERAINDGLTIAEEVWNWVISSFMDNDRAKSMIKTHRPDLARLT